MVVGVLAAALAACGGDGSQSGAGYTQSQTEVPVGDLATPRARVTRRVERMTGGDAAHCKQGFTHESYKCSTEPRNDQGRRLVLTLSVKGPGLPEVTGCEIAGDPNSMCGIQLIH